MATLKDNVKKMVEAGVPEDKIAAYIKQYSGKDTPFAPEPEPSAAMQAVKNIPGSAVGYGKTLAQLAMHPKQSAETLGKALAGGVQAAIASGNDNEATRTFRSMVDTYKQRHGSPERSLQTLIKDPVGTVADVSTLLMGGGGLMRLGGLAPKTGGLARAGKAVQQAGAAAEPLSLAMRGAGQVGRVIPSGAIRKAYEGAAKFSTTLTAAEREALTKTALKHDIAPSIKGVNAVNDKIGEINRKITDYIEGATSQYQMENAFTLENLGQGISSKSVRGMPVDELFKDFEALKTEVMKASSKPMSDVRAINNIEKQIREANEILGRGELSPVEAQKLKQKIYRDISSQYAQFKNSPASAKAQKSIARAAKEYLEEIFPEIKQLNADEGALIELRDAVQKSANRITNRDLIGIGAPLKAGAGGVAGGAPGAVAGYILGILDTPSVKSKLALAANRLKTRGVKIRPTSAVIRLGLLNVGREVEKRSTTTPIRNVGSITEKDVPRLLGAE